MCRVGLRHSEKQPNVHHMQQTCLPVDFIGTRSAASSYGLQAACMMICCCVGRYGLFNAQWALAQCHDGRSTASCRAACARLPGPLMSTWPADFHIVPATSWMIIPYEHCIMMICSQLQVITGQQCNCHSTT
jgi:hypothetical protein